MQDQLDVEKCAVPEDRERIGDVHAFDNPDG